jgi:hypothetical protein
MKEFIELYNHFMSKANLYLAKMYELQETYNVELELGGIERDYRVEAIVVEDDIIKIQVYKSGYDWGGISDDVIVLPECIDTKIAELKVHCEEVVAKRNEYNEARLKEQELRELQEFKRLAAKYGESK